MFGECEPPLPTYFIKGGLSDVAEKLKIYFENSELFAGKDYFFFINNNYDPRKERNKDIKDIKSIHLASNKHPGEGFAAAVALGLNGVATLLAYKSRPDEVHIAPVFYGDKKRYTVDENSLGEIGIRVSERIFM